ncbi:MAG: hypothetical protein Q8K04_13470 [Lutibacter sp.]|jgi:hypothetical protein|nr:hypothetical protein [Lutibacter sp.]MDP3946680.1 hypothetical protein [Lutibacter sp.]
MDQKLLFVSALILVFIQFSKVQNTSGNYLVRTNTGISGTPEIISVNNMFFVT